MFPLASDIQRLEMDVSHKDIRAEILNGLLTHEVTLREIVGASGINPPMKHSRYALLTRVFIKPEDPEYPPTYHYFPLFYDKYKYQRPECCYGYDLSQCRDITYQYFVGKGSQKIRGSWYWGRK